MPRSKKPDVPKFEPVFIAGRRPEIYSLAMPEDERNRMLAEDSSRIALHQMTVALERLKVLQNHLGLSGPLGDQGSLLVMLLKVANKYVRGFEVQVGAQPKRGRQKVGDRFKTVTEVESAKILQNLPTIAAAIDAVAAERRPAIRPQELSTKYYAYLREIEANKQAKALLFCWRQVCSNRPDLVQDPFFDSMFWTCERDQLPSDSRARPTRSAASVILVQSPLTKRAMALRSLAPMRPGLSSTGVGLSRAASARGAGSLVSIVSACCDRRFGAEHLRKIDVLSKFHGSLVRLLDGSRGADLDRTGDIGHLGPFTE
jgi:hypothetical protein